MIAGDFMANTPLEFMLAAPKSRSISSTYRQIGRYRRNCRA